MIDPEGYYYNKSKYRTIKDQTVVLVIVMLTKRLAEKARMTTADYTACI